MKMEWIAYFEENEGKAPSQTKAISSIKMLLISEQSPFGDQQ